MKTEPASVPAQTSPAISSNLMLVLRAAKAIMGVVTVLLILGALIFMVSNPLRNWLLSGVDMTALPTTRSLAFACCNSAVIAAAWYFVLDKLTRVVRTIQIGDPFVEENVSRMRWMWILIACAEIFRMVAVFLFGLMIGEAGDGTAFRIDIRIGTWFLVFVIAALSEAFRMGVELRRDQELTI